MNLWTHTRQRLQVLRTTAGQLLEAVALVEQAEAAGQQSVPAVTAAQLLLVLDAQARRLQELAEAFAGAADPGELVVTPTPRPREER